MLGFLPPMLGGQPLGREELLAQRGYKIDKKLGSGTFGVVVQVSGPGGTHAVKEVTNASQLNAALQREIQVLKFLEHPSIVRLVTVFDNPAADTVYIVMELVTGGDMMCHLVQNPQVFNEPMSRAFMFHIACALGFAAEKGIMHRDLKPENVLIGNGWIPKIADFGFARSVGTSPQNMFCISMVGSPGYVAPEVKLNQTNQMPYNFPADVYSCGLVFMDMLAPQYVCEWNLKTFPAEVREQLKKKWPNGAKPPKKSRRLEQLEQRMLCQVPGERITFFHFIQELVKLANEDPMPCPMWQVPTRQPTGPPQQSPGLRAADAAHLAGSMGFAANSPVLFNAGGKWRKGVVEHISTTSCPGAAQVRVDGTVVLVCPWQFMELLRPDTSVAPVQQQPNPTGSMTSNNTIIGASVPVAGINSEAAKGYGKSRRKEVPQATGACSTACGVIPNFLRMGRK